MLKLFLFKLWPALVPIILYLVYRMITPRKDDAVIDAKRTQHWPYVILLSIIICAFIILYSVVNTPSNTGTEYTPAQLKNGELVEESVTP